MTDKNKMLISISTGMITCLIISLIVVYIILYRIDIGKQTSQSPTSGVVSTDVSQPTTNPTAMTSFATTDGKLTFDYLAAMGDNQVDRRDDGFTIIFAKSPIYIVTGNDFEGHSAASENGLDEKVQSADGKEFSCHTTTNQDNGYTTASCGYSPDASRTKAIWLAADLKFANDDELSATIAQIQKIIRTLKYQP